MSLPACSLLSEFMLLFLSTPVLEMHLQLTKGRNYRNYNCKNMQTTLGRVCVDNNFATFGHANGKRGILIEGI